MIFTTLDTIVRRTLLERRLPIHYYVEFLTHASTCLRELTFDTLQIINTVTLTPNAAGQADLPCSYVDEVGMFLPAGQYLTQMVHRDNITPLVNYNTVGQAVPYSDGTTANEDLSLLLGWPGGAWFWNVNSLGESTGRLFGIDTTLFNPNGYKIIPERGQVQFTETFMAPYAVFMFISDGQTLDNASQITPMAITTIQAWIDWKRSKNAAADMSPEAMTYKRARKTLRSRLNDLNLMDIKQIIRSNYQDAPKT